MAVLRAILQALGLIALLLLPVPASAIEVAQPVTAASHCQETTVGTEQDGEDRQDKSKPPCCKNMGNCSPITGPILEAHAGDIWVAPAMGYRMMSDTLRRSVALPPPIQPPTFA
jgi:hypothetical protein